MSEKLFNISCFLSLGTLFGGFLGYALVGDLRVAIAFLPVAFWNLAYIIFYYRRR